MDMESHCKHDDDGHNTDGDDSSPLTEQKEQGSGHIPVPTLLSTAAISISKITNIADPHLAHNSQIKGGSSPVGHEKETISKTIMMMMTACLSSTIAMVYMTISCCRPPLCNQTAHRSASEPYTINEKRKHMDTQEDRSEVTVINNQDDGQQQPQVIIISEDDNENMAYLALYIGKDSNRGESNSNAPIPLPSSTPSTPSSSGSFIPPYQPPQPSQKSPKQPTISGHGLATAYTIPDEDQNMVDNLAYDGNGSLIVGDHSDGDHNTINISMDISTTRSHHDTDEDLIFEDVDCDIREATEVNPDEWEKDKANAQTPVRDGVIYLTLEREESAMANASQANNVGQFKAPSVDRSASPKSTPPPRYFESAVQPASSSEDNTTNLMMGVDNHDNAVNTINDNDIEEIDITAKKENMIISIYNFPARQEQTSGPIFSNMHGNMSGDSFNDNNDSLNYPPSNLHSAPL